MSDHTSGRLATVEVASRILAQGNLIESDSTGHATVALGRSTHVAGVLIPSVRGRVDGDDQKNQS